MGEDRPQAYTAHTLPHESGRFSANFSQSSALR
jgi:hypothetical protein